MDWGLGLVANNPLTRGLVSGAQAVGQDLVSGAQAVGHGLVTLNNRVNHAIDNYLDPVVPEADTFAQRGYPAYMRTTGLSFDDPQRQVALNNQVALGHYDPKTLPQQIPVVKAYRADPTGKFGGTDGLETMPMQFNPRSFTGALYRSDGGTPAFLYSYARELARAGKYGVPQLSAQQLAALAIKEGRADYGSNGASYTLDRTNQALAAKLYPNHPQPLEGAQDFPVLVAEKMATAKRLGIPFAEAWNGAGRSDVGSTGAQYASDYQNALKAAAHPKNVPLVQLIQSGLDAGAQDK